MHSRLLILRLTLCACAFACGRGNSFNGTVDGQSLVPKGAFSKGSGFSLGDPGEVLLVSIVLSSSPSCPSPDVNGATELILDLYVFAPSGGSAVTPGSFSIGATTGKRVIASFAWPAYPDLNSDADLVNRATSGSVVLDWFDPPQGRFDLLFGTNHVNGTFDATTTCH